MEPCVIGIDLGGTNLKGVVMNRAGQSRHLTRVPTEADKGGARVLENILTLIGRLVDKEGSKNAVAGIGIGTPGFVGADGTMLGGCENIPGWKGTNFYQPILRRFGLKTVGGNDVTVLALAESKFGAGKGIANMVCFALGTGIGGGIVINHRVYMGTHGMAGELGHLVVENNGLQCTCGIKGCVEQYASATGIVKNAQIICEQEAGKNNRTKFVEAVLNKPHSVTSKIVYEWVAKEDPVALAINEYVCERLARAIGMALNAFAPDRIVLGGGVMMAGQVIVDTVAKHVPKYCWPSIWERCDIVAAQCGESAGVLGAAALAFDELGI